MGVYDSKPCPCGSGQLRDPNFDGYGIFLTFTCPACHTDKMSRFRPDIHTQYECDEPINPD